MSQPIASFSGIASGIQWRDMVDQIIAGQRQPVARLESQLQLVQRRVTSWRTVQGGVTQLRDALKPLANQSAFARFTTSFTGLSGTETPPVAVSAADGSTPGSFQLRVEGLARAAKIGGASFESRTEAVGVAGTLLLNDRPVTITADDSLDRIAASINAANRGAEPSGVSATIIRTPEGSHRLVLTAERTGANGIRLGGDGAMLQDLALSTDPASVSVIVEGVDAALRVDGALYRSSSNTFGDIVDGVTFTLLRESATPVDATITRDVAASRSAVQALVDAYNGLAEIVRQQSNSATRAPLAGSAVLRGMPAAIRAELDRELEAAAGELSRLAEVGIQIDRSGRYTFDAKTFDDRLAADPAGVSALFGTIAKAAQDAADRILTGKSGSIPDIISELEAGTPRLSARIEELEDRLERRREDLYRRFTRMEQVLSQAQTQSQWLASQLAQFEPPRR